MRSRAWTPGERRWEVAPPFEAAGEWARQLGTGPLVAQVLHNRGAATLDAARAFLNPKLTDLHDPALLSGSADAARRIARAAAAKEKIVLYGDYDVDGITGLAILHGCLKLLGCESEFYVPHRQDEGYGVNAPAVRKIVEGGAKLLVTVDCGISDGEALAEAARAGVDVIVTDHHGLPAQLPAAAAIVHPALGGYPNPDLCGAGVAFKLAWAVAREVGGETKVSDALREFLIDATCLAALGTIADVVPLTGENRVLAAYGLKGLASTKHAGMRALLDSADLGGRAIEADDVGFTLGPRINASGRMGHARQAVELLLGSDPSRCRQIADHLARLNTQRQEIERAILDQAADMVRDRKLDVEGNPAIVLASEGWNSGVIGIVAGRLAERFHKPTVLIAIPEKAGEKIGEKIGTDPIFRGEKRGLSLLSPAQGSCRSIPGLDMREALAACSVYLLGFGGHAMAGGLRIAPGKIDAFAAAFAVHARTNLSPRELIPALAIDATATLAGLGFAAVEHLAKLAPFGQGNAPPLLAIEGCKVLTEPRRMGRSGKTIAFHLGQNGASLRAVGFGMAELADRLHVGAEVSVAAEPTINRFNGSASVELRLRDVRPSRKPG
jgi:single-stranded-DNA-specific exonuclease